MMKLQTFININCVYTKQVWLFSYKQILQILLLLNAAMLFHHMV